MIQYIFILYLYYKNIPIIYVESLLLELEKIRNIELQNGEIIVTELTRKQKEIMEKLNLCA